MENTNFYSLFLLITRRACLVVGSKIFLRYIKSASKAKRIHLATTKSTYRTHILTLMVPFWIINEVKAKCITKDPVLLGFLRKRARNASFAQIRRNFFNSRIRFCLDPLFKQNADRQNKQSTTYGHLLHKLKHRLISK